MSKMPRVSFTLLPQVVKDLAFISERLGVSRSSIIGDILGEPLADLRSLLEQVPASPTEGDVLRLRGKSEEVITQRLSELRGVMDAISLKHEGR